MSLVLDSLVWVGYCFSRVISSFVGHAIPVVIFNGGWVRVCDVFFTCVIDWWI